MHDAWSQLCLHITPQPTAIMNTTLVAALVTVIALVALLLAFGQDACSGDKMELEMSKIL